jgi:hypothetical protein
MSLDIKINSTGLSKTDKQFKTAKNKIDKIQSKILSEIALKIRSGLVERVKNNGSRTGIRYKISKKGWHTASAPGEAPADRTGTLARTLGVSIRPRLSLVLSTVEYSKYFEEGTRNMAARPWLQPTVDENNEFIEKTCMKISDIFK